MSQTISSSISTGITLSVPATITAAGVIAVTGSGAAVMDGSGPGELTNDGQIYGGFFGVSLAAGGVVTNQSSAGISGLVGVDILNNGSIYNSGLISGIAYGIMLNEGVIKNTLGAEISGSIQINSGTLVNNGTIVAKNGSIVNFKDGGVVQNLGTAANITGGAVLGVAIAGASGYVENQGTIAGIVLNAGGTVINQGAVGLGNAATAISINGGSGYISNSGNILGVALSSNGVVHNAASGTISGYLDGVDLASGGSVSNSGAIFGVGGPFGQIIPSDAGNDGISIAGAGIINNTSTASLIEGTNIGVQVTGDGPGAVTIVNHGTIAGKMGIEIADATPATIIEYGTIIGTKGVAVSFGSGNDTLVIEPGAVINGLVEGGTGTDVIEINASIISNLGSFVNVDQFIFSAADLSLAGTNILGSGETLDNTSHMTIGGTLQIKGVLDNSGTILGQIQLAGGTNFIPASPPAVFSNAAGGMITSTLAAAISASAGINPSTIENAGTISDTAPGGVAIQFTGGGADVLILDPGSVINGIVNGGTATSSILVLNSAATHGELSFIGSSFMNFATVAVETGAVWDINSSTIAALENAGTIILDPTTMTVNGPLTGTGVTQIETGSTLILNGAAASGGTIAFSGTNATLDLGDPAQFNAILTGMGPTDTIDLAHLSFNSLGAVSLTESDILQISEDNTLVSIQIDPTKNYANAVFHISSDGLNGTNITEAGVPCFLAGTKIATPKGEIAVERLKIGDLVSTGTGQAKPVKWIGRRSYKAPLPDDPDVIPVRIKANALAANVPSRDLYLSPLHAVMLEGRLVPAGALVNDVSVCSCVKMKTVSYFHIEMENHETVIANGAEAETFIDQASRRMFENADEYFRLYPEGWAASYVLYAPRLEFGVELERLRRKVALRAGVLLDQPQSHPVIGFLEEADRQSISGWAYAPLSPHMPVSLDILNRGALLARTVANIPRPDVKTAGFGNGRCGFSIRLPAPLPALLRHEISVRPSGSHICLTGSPAVIDPGIAHDLLKTGGLQNLIEAAVKGMGSPKDVAVLGNVLEAAGKQILLRAAAPQSTAPAAAKASQPVVLVLDENWPAAGSDAGSNAVLSHIKGFQALGYHVAFCATSGPPKSGAAYAGLNALQTAGVECHGQDGSTVEAVIRATNARGLALVYLHRLAVASAYGGLVRQYARAAKVIFAVADLHHMRLARQAHITARPDLLSRARSVMAAELWAMQMADFVLTHSAYEAAYLRHVAPLVNVKIVPWAVPVSQPKGAMRARKNIAFIGGAGHAPNVDAVAHLARDIMPMVWQHDPAIKCYVAGPGWAEHFFRKFDLRVVNLGYQQDLLPLLNTVKLTVAPLRFGAGIKGKVLESMAAGTACVMSNIAAEGLRLDGYLHSVTGNGEAFAKNILKLYGDKKHNRLVVQSGLDMVIQGYSQDAVVAALAGLTGVAARRQEALFPVQ